MAVRANLLVLVGSVLTLSAMSDGLGQAPNAPDLDKAILGQIKEAYKAVYEAPKDFRDELNGYYKKPTPQREAAMLKEVRRLYLLTAQQEQAILQEIRKAYEQWSPEQEERIFREIGKAQRLPEGTVPPTVQANQMSKLFAKLDLNGDGVLSAAEMTGALSAERARWDVDRDGLISPEEYVAYYQSRLRWISEQVATGNIELGLKRGGPDLSKVPQPDMSLQPDESRPIVYRAGNLPAGLPAWFVQLDTDMDGQVALYEWYNAGKPLPEFELWDRDGDGLATPAEVLRRMAQINRDSGLASSNGGPTSTLDQKNAKKTK